MSHFKRIKHWYICQVPFIDNTYGILRSLKSFYSYVTVRFTYCEIPRAISKLYSKEVKLFYKFQGNIWNPSVRSNKCADRQYSIRFYKGFASRLWGMVFEIVQFHAPVYVDIFERSKEELNYDTATNTCFNLKKNLCCQQIENMNFQQWALCRWKWRTENILLEVVLFTIQW